MLLLTSTSDIIRIITGSAADIEVHASWVDKLAGSEPTPGRTNTASITSATTTTIVGSPAASTSRNVKHLNITNNHGSTATTISVEHYDGSTAETLVKLNLLAGESVIFDANGNWKHYDTSGGAYVSPGAIATQAEMEAGASLITVVSPGRQQFHPSACKFWCNVTGAGSPSLQSNYNVTSIADTAIGRMTVTIATDFSSANWCCSPAVFTTTTTGDEGIPNINSKAAGTVEIGCRIITPAFGDPNVGYDVAGWGDQA